MAARGAYAKEYLKKKIIDAFSDNFLGEVDGKIYFQIEDNGEVVPISIGFTCPKTVPFDMSSAQTEVGSSATSEITDLEKENIRQLMSALGLMEGA